MKEVEGFITYDRSIRFVDRITAAMYRLNLFDCHGYFEIISRENEVEAWIIHITGWAPIVKFLEIVTEYKGKNLVSWNPVRNDDGSYTWVRES